MDSNSLPSQLLKFINFVGIIAVVPLLTIHKFCLAVSNPPRHQINKRGIYFPIMSIKMFKLIKLYIARSQNKIEYQGLIFGEELGLNLNEKL